MAAELPATSPRRLRLRHRLRIAAYVLALAGVLMTAFGVQGAYAKNDALDRAVRTDGLVTQVEKSNETTFVFETPGGQRTGTRNVYRIRNEFIPYEPGETLKVHYDPEPPHELLWVGWTRPPHLRAFLEWMSAGLGVILTVLALGLVLPRGALLREWP